MPRVPPSNQPGVPPGIDAVNIVPGRTRGAARPSYAEESDGEGTDEPPDTDDTDDDWAGAEKVTFTGLTQTLQVDPAV
jgi:hypothetical protein